MNTTCKLISIYLKDTSFELFLHFYFFLCVDQFYYYFIIYVIVRKLDARNSIRFIIIIHEYMNRYIFLNILLTRIYLVFDDLIY